MSKTKQLQVVALGQLGWSLRRIETETGIRRETVGKYLRRHDVPIREPRRWGHGPPKPAKEVITDSGDDQQGHAEVITDLPAEMPRPGCTPGMSACEPFRDLIEARLRIGRNGMAIWQELVEEHGFSARYASVQRFIRKLRAAEGQETRVVIQTPPGQEAQVDYGTGPMIRDAVTGKYRRSRLFVLTLGYSRKSVRLLVPRSSSRTWCQLHERAFRRLGGVPKVLVLDNLREGVAKADIYDPEINPLFRDMLAHYGVAALPCRVRNPDRKGKVESSVGHTKRTALKGLRFESLEDAQRYLDHWCERWADTRIHGSTKRQVNAMFEEERPALGPLPVEPFRYYEHGMRTVHLDGCVEVHAAYYGAPPGMIGHRVPVQWDELFVRILDPATGQLLREHERQAPGRYRVQPGDEPARTPATTRKLLLRAENVGKNTGALCHTIHSCDGETGVRRILGVLSLAKKHGCDVVEDACQAALEVGAPTYQFVKRYLQRRPSLKLTLRQVDPLIRELTLYRDVVQHITEPEQGAES